MIEDPDTCEGCGRSIVSCYGGPAPAECEACCDEFARLVAAGRTFELCSLNDESPLPRKQ